MPDNNRMVVTIFMTMMTFSHVLSKILATALIMRLSSLWLLLYSGGDMLLFFGYKIFRGDLRY